MAILGQHDDSGSPHEHPRDGGHDADLAPEPGSPIDGDGESNGERPPERTEFSPPLEPLDHRHLTLLLSPIAVLLVMTQIGGVLFAQLSIQKNPILLITLSANNRNLAIAGTAVDRGDLLILVYFAIGFVRLLAPDPFFYELGWHYGDRAVGWMERRTPTFGQIMRQLETWFPKAGWALVLIMPNNYVCLIAGNARMRRSWFWTLNVVGTIGRLIVMLWVGTALADWIEKLLGLIADYRWPLLAVSVGIFAFTTMREWRSGSAGIQQIVELEHELEHEAEAVGDDQASGS